MPDCNKQHSTGVILKCQAMTYIIHVLLCDGVFFAQTGVQVSGYVQASSIAVMVLSQRAEVGGLGQLRDI